MLNEKLIDLKNLAEECKIASQEYINNVWVPLNVAPDKLHSTQKKIDGLYRLEAKIENMLTELRYLLTNHF